jgi:hypothetical protein
MLNSLFADRDLVNDAANSDVYGEQNAKECIGHGNQQTFGAWRYGSCCDGRYIARACRHAVEGE